MSALLEFDADASLLREVSAGIIRPVPHEGLLIGVHGVMGSHSSDAVASVRAVIRVGGVFGDLVPAPPPPPSAGAVQWLLEILQRAKRVKVNGTALPKVDEETVRRIIDGCRNAELAASRSSRL